MDKENLDQLLNKIHEDGVRKAEQHAEKIIKQAEQKAQGMIESAEQKVKHMYSFQERETEKSLLALKDAIKISVRDLSLKLESEIINKFSRILNSKITSILKNDDAQILKWVLESNTYEINQGITIESFSCGSDEFKGYILSEFKDKIESIDFELSEHIGFRVKLKAKNIILDYTNTSITNHLMEVLGDDFKKILDFKKGASDELKFI